MSNKWTPSHQGGVSELSHSCRVVGEIECPGKSEATTNNVLIPSGAHHEARTLLKERKFREEKSLKKALGKESTKLQQIQGLEQGIK